MMRLSAAATSCSDCVMPGRSAFVESASISVDAVVAEPGELGEVGAAGRRSACGRSCSRRCAGSCPRSVCSATATASGIECVTRANSASNGPHADRVALAVDLDELGVAQQAVLVELRLDQAEREPRAPDLAHADLAHHVRQRADVVLVAVREDDRVDAARRARAGRRSRAARGRRRASRRAGTMRPAVDQDAPLALLDDGHVLADLAEAAERDDAYDVAHAAAVRPLAARAERSTAHCSSVASTSGRRGRPTRSPSELERRLERDRVGGHGERLVDGRELASSARAPSKSPAAARSQMRSMSRADEVRGDADAADAAELAGTARAGRRCRRRARARRRGSRAPGRGRSSPA